MAAELKEQVEEKIKSKKVVLYKKEGCPYCKMAKEIFKQLIDEGTLKKEDYEEVDVQNRGDIQGLMQELTGARTVPRVFVNGKCIGGGSEVQAMFKSGQLATELKQ